MNDEKTKSPYITIAETAQLLRRAPGTIYKFAREGKFGNGIVKRFGRGYLIHKEKLKEWMEKNVCSVSEPTKVSDDVL